MVLRSCWLITLLCMDSHHTCSRLIHADGGGGDGDSGGGGGGGAFHTG